MNRSISRMSRPISCLAGSQNVLKWRSKSIIRSYPIAILTWVERIPQLALIFSGQTLDTDRVRDDNEQGTGPRS